VESVVLLDETGFARGTAAKAAVHHARTPLHLAFSCYLFNDAGQFLLTRRAESKRTWPGVWTNTCCGHPLPGEPVADSVRRRLRQELGIADAELVLVLPRFRYQAQMANGVLENEVCPVYAAYSDAASFDTGPAPDPAEVAEIAWVAWDQFCDAVDSGRQPVSPWCEMQVPELMALGPYPLAWMAADEADLPPAAVLAGLSTLPSSGLPTGTLPRPHDVHRVVHIGGFTGQAPAGGVSGASGMVLGGRPRASSSSTSSSTSSGTRPPAVHSAQRMPTKLPMPV
jgi:isopentenyl-diphosphate delta-isomerase